MSYFLTNFKQTLYSEYKITGGGILGQKQKQQILSSIICVGESCRKITYAHKDNPNKSYLIAEIIF